LLSSFTGFPNRKPEDRLGVGEVNYKVVLSCEAIQIVSCSIVIYIATSNLHNIFVTSMSGATKYIHTFPLRSLLLLLLLPLILVLIGDLAGAIGDDEQTVCIYIYALLICVS
jgi:hypothetical protein